MQPPLHGSAIISEISGYHPDGFIGKRMLFRCAASEPLHAVSIQGYCPPHHLGPLQLDCSVDDLFLTRVEVQPGATFQITCDVAIATGNAVRVELESSAVMNLLERGESEDGRDLSVLISLIEAR